MYGAEVLQVRKQDCWVLPLFLLQRMTDHKVVLSISEHCRLPAISCAAIIRFIQREPHFRMRSVTISIYGTHSVTTAVATTTIFGSRQDGHSPLERVPTGTTPQ